MQRLADRESRSRDFFPLPSMKVNWDCVFEKVPIHAMPQWPPLLIHIESFLSIGPSREKKGTSCRVWVTLSSWELTENVNNPPSDKVTTNRSFVAWKRNYRESGMKKNVKVFCMSWMIMTSLRAHFLSPTHICASDIRPNHTEWRRKSNEFQSFPIRWNLSGCLQPRRTFLRRIVKF